MPSTFVYVNDILIASTSLAEHRDDICRVLTILQQNNLAASLAKSKFFKNKLIFLGHQISAKGSSIPRDRIKALLDIIIPDTPKAMQKFLGALNFYRRHILNYSAAVQLLHKAASHSPSTMIRQWDQATRQAFEHIKT